MKPASSPHYDLQNSVAYQRWRKRKIAAYPLGFAQLMVELNDATRVTDRERMRLGECLSQHNMVLYRTPDRSENKQIPLQLGALFGLSTLDRNIAADDDAVSEIQLKGSGVHGRYIPYTSRPLSWHTDGYYNRPTRQIRAMMLHCVRAACVGGETELFDPEMAYIYLRDLNPDYIRALSQADVLTIPANEEAGKRLREAQSGPVFSLDKAGNLHMRYSARTRNILWKKSPLVEAAVEALSRMFTQANDWIIRGSLGAGEGLICNNVLHNRRAFEDDARAPRLLYRLRYYERVNYAMKAGGG